uniref:Uncharacterized protein n=1 Tax=Picea glauca TaxID=3330 RepID=A0A124GN36_PICGL|nr:hypothetical protein ABT39_MTgene5757 [Picea glauca]
MAHCLMGGDKRESIYSRQQKPRLMKFRCHPMPSGNLSRLDAFAGR